MTKNILNNINLKCLNILYSETILNKVRFYSSDYNNIIVYDDVLNDKTKILGENKQKCGIYKWVNKINGKSYLGSSVNLSSRLSSYLSTNFLSRKTSISKSKIYNALLYHGYSHFRLEILEYCDSSDVIEKEQFHIDSINPEYNILVKAGSSLHFKHSAETLLKFKSRKFSNEALHNLKK